MDLNQDQEDFKRKGINKSIRTSNIRIKHMNCRSIREKETRKSLIVSMLLKSTNTEDPIDFLLLSETNIQEAAKVEEWIKYSEIGHLYTVKTDSLRNEMNNKGTAIIMLKQWIPYIDSVEGSPGTVTAITLLISDKVITIAAIYMPNRSEETEKLVKKTETFLRSLISKSNENKHPSKIPFLILMGDWNGEMDPSLDRILINEDKTIKISTKTTPKSNFLERITSEHQVTPMIDAWRFFNPDKIEFTHEQKLQQNAVSKARIDYSLVNANALRYIDKTWHDADYIDALDHKGINLSLKLPAERIGKARQHKKPRPSWDTSEINSEHYAKSAELLSISPCILELAAGNTPNPDQLEIDRLYDTVNQTITSILNSTIPKSDRKVKPNPIRIYRNTLIQDNDLAEELMLAHKYHPDISTTLRIQDLFSKYKEYEGEASPPQPRQIIRLVKFRLEKLFRKLKDESIKKKKEKITKRYATQQKKTIKNIMGGTIEWDGVQFVRLESSVITKPDEIKEEVYKYYKNKTTPQQDRPDVEKPDGFDEIYEPDPDLEETMWDKLLDPITTEETLDTINNLPSGKAPGGNGITYDIIKLLFSKNEINLAALTQLLNYSIKTGLFPRNGSKGIITLLPKIHSWSGQLAKTRPITLLDSHRKIFEAILNKRMSTIIYGNNMLKGVNFGFSPGVGTTESIAMIKHIIDISNIRGSTLHAAILDVQAAYDTVPHSAVYESLKKMKAPIELINLLSNLDSNRSLQIDTPFGLTKPFHPILGLAQGSILSPLLWNIFYNPLLCLLQKKTVGIKVLESRITAIAYADDIHPVASTNADLQLQLNIIHDFLLVHGMSMNVAKTHILSNEAQSSENYPADLSMGTTQITSYKGRSEISRILGVYISMDGSSKETIKQAIETLDSQITRLNIKFMPSRVATNIINSVILPKLAFRLQVANIPITTLRKIDAKLRKLTKKKCSLPLNTPNDFLYDKSYGFSLNSIESILPSQLISNTMAMLRSHGNIGSFLHEVERFYQAQLKTPMSIFASPLPFGTKGKSGDSLAKQISNTLYKNKFQIRGLHHFDPAHHFTQILSIDEYVKSYKNIAKLNLNNLEDFIQTKSSGVRETRASRSNSNKTRSFNIIDEGLDQKNLKRPEKYLDEQAIGCIAPKWFSQIICHLTKQQFKNIHKDELFDIPNPVNDQHPSIETSLTNEHNILSAEVYVDGSFKTGEMGSAALFLSKYTNLQEELPKRAFVLSKPTHHNASIEKAEKWALLKGLEPFDSKTKLNIYSDSDITINAVALIMNDQLSSRNILKIEDYPIIEKIKHEMNRFETRPILHKVKSHSGNTIHDEVDALSKQARADYTLPYTDVTPYKIGTTLDRDLHLYIQKIRNHTV